MQRSPYGFCSITADGALYTVINPSQQIVSVKIPQLYPLEHPLSGGRIQLRDAGFSPKLSGDRITLGPEQMALAGFGEYAKARYDLGVQEDIVIPEDIRPLKAEFLEAGTNAAAATLTAPRSDLRIVMRQFIDGRPRRISRGAPPTGTSLGKILQIRVLQDNRLRPVSIKYDKALWSGLSWAVGEVKGSDLKPGRPMTVECASLQEKPVKLEVQFYEVNY